MTSFSRKDGVIHSEAAEIFSSSFSGFPHISKA